MRLPSWGISKDVMLTIILFWTCYYEQITGNNTGDGLSARLLFKGEICFLLTQGLWMVL